MIRRLMDRVVALMRVLILNYEWPPAGGGAGRATMHISRELRRLGVSVDVICSRGDVAGCETVNDVPVTFVKTHRKSVHEAGFAAMLEFLARASIPTARRLRSRQYDVVHYFFSVPTGLLSFLQPRRLPYVVSIRGGDVPGYCVGEFGRMHRMITPINRRIWLRAAAVVAVSDHLGRYARSVAPTLNYRVIYNGVDTDLFRPDAAKPLSITGPIRLLSVGRLVEWKGMQFIIEAMTQLLDMDVNLTIIGRGYYEADLRRLAARLGVQDRVTFLSNVAHEELPEQYRQADVFVLPSYGDSFANVFTEAMACGLPIVAAREGGAMEAVVDGANGFLVVPRSAEALVQPLKTLIANSMLRRQMGQESARIAATRFQWREVAKQYLEVYKAVRQ